MTATLMNGRSPRQDFDMVVGIATDDKERLIRGALHDWRLMISGAVLLVGLLGGAYKLGLFGLQEQMAVLNSQHKSVENTVASFEHRLEAATNNLDRKIEALGGKIDAGFDKLRDRVEAATRRVDDGSSTAIAVVPPPSLSSSSSSAPAKKVKKAAPPPPEQPSWIARIIKN